MIIKIAWVTTQNTFEYEVSDRLESFESLEIGCLGASGTYLGIKEIKTGFAWRHAGIGVVLS